MISLHRILLSLGHWTSKTLSVHFFFARRMPTPFVPSELPDQKTLYTESFPFNHRTWERDWDGHSTPFHLVSWRKPQSSLLLVAVYTISALRPLIVPTFTAHNWNLKKKIVSGILIEILQSSHDLAYVKTAQFSRYVQNCGSSDHRCSRKNSTNVYFTMFRISVHKP